jgi:rhomboid protease GluP
MHLIICAFISVQGADLYTHTHAHTHTLQGAAFFPSVQDGQVWRLFLPIMLHANIFHLLFNMYLFNWLGHMFEARWGVKLYIALFVLTGITASLWSVTMARYTDGPVAYPVSVGASGALFGLLGADVVFLAIHKDVVSAAKKEAMLLGICIAITALVGIFADGVDNFAHLGGLLSGCLLGPCTFTFLVVHPQEQIIKYATLAGYLLMNLILVVFLFK